MTTFTLTDLSNQAQRLTAQIELLQQQRNALLITEQLLRGDAGDTTDTVDATDDTPSPVNDTPTPRLQDSPINNLPIHNFEGLEVDFTGARNLLERLRRIGQATEGHYLSLGLLTYYLEKARPSRKGSRRSLKTYIRTCISKHPEYFQRVGPGIYRYYDNPRPRSVWQIDGYDQATDPEH